jgi:hypothetical protein
VRPRNIRASLLFVYARQVKHSWLAHVGEVHRRAGRVLGGQ